MASDKYFNKGVNALDSPHIGHVIREAEDRIVVFGGGDDRYDIPKSKVNIVSGNVLIDRLLYEIVKKYEVGRAEPLPAGKAVQDPWIPHPATLILPPTRENIQYRCSTRGSGRRTKST